MLLPIHTSACTWSHSGKEPGWLCGLLGSCQPHAGQGRRETAVSVGIAARGDLTLPALLRPNRARSQVELGGRCQSEPWIAGGGSLLAASCTSLPQLPALHLMCPVAWGRAFLARSASVCSPSLSSALGQLPGLLVVRRRHCSA